VIREHREIKSRELSADELLQVTGGFSTDVNAAENALPENVTEQMRWMSENGDPFLTVAEHEVVHVPCGCMMVYYATSRTAVCPKCGATKSFHSAHT
jgi:hypothetical protein